MAQAEQKPRCNPVIQDRPKEPLPACTCLIEEDDLRQVRALPPHWIWRCARCRGEVKES